MLRSFGEVAKANAHSAENGAFFGCFFGVVDFTQTRGIRGVLVVKSVEKKPRFFLYAICWKTEIRKSLILQEIKILDF